MNMARVVTLDCFKGALLGTAAGDALGMPVEGWTAEQIKYQYGVLEDMVDSRAGRGTYTDDTEMMIALAESLIRMEKVDKEDLARSFLDNFHQWRGYGPGTRRILDLLRNGTGVNEAALTVFPGGSYGNGSVMRSAPVGLFYSDKPDLLRRASYEQSRVTHYHPVACEGAYLQARVIAIMIEKRHVSRDFDPAETLSELFDSVSKQGRIFYQALKNVRMLLRKFPDESEVVSLLGNDVTALHSWPAALYSFLSHPGSFEDAVVYAVNLGGDSDTIGAMTGALAGAFHGAAAIPERWINALEDGDKGRSHISMLAQRLFKKKYPQNQDI